MSPISLKTTIALAAGAAFAAFAETAVTDDGDVRTYNVPLNETYQESSVFPETALTVVKTGGGTLEVLAANNSRKAALTFEIREGYVKTAISSDPFGGEKTLIKVSKNAALWFTGTSAGQKARTFYSVEIEGDGPDGKGAFYRTGSSGGDCLITKLKLTDGATIGGDMKFGVRYTDLNSHTLTNKVVSASGETLVYASHEYGSRVENPGNIVQLSNVVMVDALRSWDGDYEGKSWTVSKTSFMDFFQQSVPFPWEALELS